MPTYDQAAFVRRAVSSLLAQTYANWQLLVIDDGSPDETAALVEPYLRDPRISLHRLERNEGLGHALNVGLDATDAPLVAYLPSDDVLHADHLRRLVDRLDAEPAAVLAHSGVRHHYNRSAPGVIDGSWLQLVQVLHRRTEDRWLERRELVTDDLERMFWGRLRRHGAFAGTGEVTCEWVDHPHQLHKVVQEPVGGINTYRSRFRVDHPLRFHTSVGNPIDEVEHHRRFRDRPPTPPAPDGLTIVLLGELAYNAERVLALEERGHRLHGLWMPEPYWYNAVGPVPFGHVQDLPREGWEDALRRLQPDVIYGLLNWQAVPFAHRVLEANPGVPFVWHFKEGPFICLEKGTWRELVELYARADGQIYSSAEMRDWFETVVPGLTAGAETFVLDGDLPKRDWFGDRRSERLSDGGRGWHTVVPGRPIGLHPHTVGELAAADVHLHFYGDFTHGQWREWIVKAGRIAPDHLHLHGQVDQDRWVEEFSRYDAGWLHFFRSENEGDLRRANWDDLNLPARLATLAVSGLPVLQRRNDGHVVATQSLVGERDLDIGLLFDDMAGLGEQLRDGERLEALRTNVWRQREQFMFDHHADDLVAFFRRVIARAGGR